MKFEIKSRWNGSVLFSIETDSLRLAVEAAVKSGANLSGANLSDADLSGAFLHGADLRGADLSVANLSDADLHGADLHGADLHGADLHGADLHGADLHGADLSGANLSDADLSGAFLHGADLRGAFLRDADLHGAFLRGADLRGAFLRDAFLHGADLRDADLSGAKYIPLLVQAQTVIVPEGNLVGWKKCRYGVIVKLLIPQHAKRSNATGRKCRAEYVKVLRVYGAEFGESQFEVNGEMTIYRKGETVKCDKWNEDRWKECGGGIHFFLTRIEAESYE